MNSRTTSERVKLDRWQVFVLIGFISSGAIFGEWLETLTSRSFTVVYACACGFFSGFFIRWTDPRDSRQLLILAAAGTAMIFLTLLACAGILMLADSASIRDLGSWAERGFGGLGIGLCFAACAFASKPVFSRLGVPLRNHSGPKV